MSETCWIECEYCGGEGYSSHDCGEDCCACIDPYDNVQCDVCGGNGGYTGVPNE